MLALSRCPSSLHTDLMDLAPPSLSLLALVGGFHPPSQWQLLSVPRLALGLRSELHLPDRTLQLGHFLFRHSFRQAALCIDPAVMLPRFLIPDYRTTLIQLQ